MGSKRPEPVSLVLRVTNNSPFPTVSVTSLPERHLVSRLESAKVLSSFDIKKVTINRRLGEALIWVRGSHRTTLAFRDPAHKKQITLHGEDRVTITKYTPPPTQHHQTKH